MEFTLHQLLNAWAIETNFSLSLSPLKKEISQRSRIAEAFIHWAMPKWIVCIAHIRISPGENPAIIHKGETHAWMHFVKNSGVEYLRNGKEPNFENLSMFQTACS